MPKKIVKTPVKRSRRSFTDEFEREGVALLLDGHSASSVAERLGMSNTNLLYRSKQAQFDESWSMASSIEARVNELEVELQRVIRERDILKKALAIFGRDERLISMLLCRALSNQAVLRPVWSAKDWT